MTNEQNRFDLGERTANFGENIILLCKAIPKNEITRPLITQLVGCGTKRRGELL